MIEALLKLAPLAILTVGGIKMASKSTHFLSFGQTTAAQIEMNEIAKLLNLTAIDGPQAIPTPDTFANFLRSNMRATGAEANRDFSKDIWGRPYRLIVDPGTLTVVSDGPDKLPDTGDDLRARIRLN